MASSIVRLLRFASVVICLIVIASFVTFAVEQTKSASGRQQEQLGVGPATRSTNSSPSPSTGSSASHEGSLHKAIDEASAQLTSPFSGIVAGSSSEWAIRIVKLFFALLVYGFGLGFLARALRVRV